MKINLSSQISVWKALIFTGIVVLLCFALFFRPKISSVDTKAIDKAHAKAIRHLQMREENLVRALKADSIRHADAIKDYQEQITHLQNEIRKYQIRKIKDVKHYSSAPERYESISAIVARFNASKNK